MTNTYERIAEVIRHIDSSHMDQPDLAALAARAGMSPFHLHRLFSNWAAITPKDFLQCLTLAHAKNLLRKGESVLDAALETGLSGPGRLHDLCVTLEAATPGELKSGGAGWTIIAGTADTPFGKCLIAQSPRGLCHLSFIESNGEAEWKALKAEWPHARLQKDPSAASRLAAQIFNRSLKSGNPLKAWVKGTVFQVRVWRALLQIPAGSVLSYGRLAAVIGAPSAARAVGSAVGQNSLAYLVPCHRVIRETGVLGDYRWGSVRKRAMLAWKVARVPNRFQHIYAVIQKIPKGRVATYGQIARLAALPNQARQVGYALSALPEESPIAWHRVVNAQGIISARSEPYSANIQRRLLEKEGIRFDSNQRIPLLKYQWKKNAE